MSDSRWVDVVRDALPAIAALMGVGVGWFAGRGREKRDMRRAAYVEWLKASRNIATWPVSVPPPLPGAVRLPHPANVARLNDATSELQLIASERVAAAAKSYIDKVTSPDLVAQVSGQVEDLDELLARFDALMEDQRREVVTSMRKDLRTKK